MPRVAVVTEGRSGLDDVVAQRFGRAPTITIVDLGADGGIAGIRIIENPGASASGGAAVKTVQVLVKEGVDLVVGPSFGPNAQAILVEMNIRSLVVGPGTKVRDALAAALKELGIPGNLHG